MNTPAVVTSIAMPELQPGEQYAGLIVQNGTPVHHVILLPAELESAKWAAAMKWAKEQGGELPSRAEQSLLFANAKDQFQGDWYWSGEPYAGDESYAWYQYFYFGFQSFNRKSTTLRARAVRRVAI